MLNENKKRFQVKVKNLDKIEPLLQETYNLACQQYTQLQDEINKVANTTKLAELDIEGKVEYGKIMANYISLQQKTISQKFEIAKLMEEIVKHNGDVDAALNNTDARTSSLDISTLRRLAKEAQSQTDDSQVYQTKN